MQLARTQRSQAAIDFMTSYGIALLLIAIAVFVVLQLGVFNYSTASQYCYPVPGFTCSAYSINTTGDLTLVMSQSTGGTVNVNGAACSTSPNTMTTGPISGNLNVLSYNYAPSFYPNNALASALALNPGQKGEIYLNCYNSGGNLAKGQIGSTFLGYVWLNYSYSNLPSNYINIQRVFSLTIKYT